MTRKPNPPHYNEAMARICVLGGTGFVGQALVSRLVTQGHQVRVLTRQRFRHRSLLVLPTLDLVQANVHKERSLIRHTEGMDIVINLVGILNESPMRQQTFKRAHVGLAQKLVSACHAHGTPRLLQMSALGVDRNARSQYLRSKAEAEATLLQFSGITKVTSFRPSLIFGPGDHLVGRFTTLLRMAPYFFPLGCPNTRFAPVYVGDVITRMCDSLDDRKTYSRSINLCGPDIYTLQQLIELIAAAGGLKRRVVPLSPSMSRMQARILGFLPGKLLTMDNYYSLQVDSVCHEADLCPTHLEPIMQAMLERS